jgi:flagellar biosynthetic protein FliP
MKVWKFVQHLLEMTIAMFAGMLVLGMAAKSLFTALDWTTLNDATVPRTLVMATTMSLGMAAWMRFRGCGWPAVVEMSLAMFVPFLVMYPFYFAGLAGDMAVMMVGHVLMVPAMVVAMLFRLDEYPGGHAHAHDESGVGAGARPTQLVGSDRSQG